MLPLAPGTNLAIAKLMLLSVSPCLTAPSEKTVKLITGAPATVTAGIPLSCSTLKAEAELIELSLAGSVAAAAIAALAGGGPDGGGGPVTTPLLPPPPHAPSAATTKTPAPHFSIECLMDTPSLLRCRGLRHGHALGCQ